ncbi:MAG: acyl-CoA thioester hydrolase [Betaproteobacteria bacterium]|jgi:acyl-CoA thioester hydrolase|nr:acyl-CoA thioester hydrolase [Betaproteobacteria bacterium]
MSLSAEVEIEIPFYDVDPMQVAWHGNYVKYFEVARCAMLRKIDYDYPQMEASGYHFPVVEIYLRYVNPARFGQLVRVAAEVLEYENRLKIGYRITDRASGERLTKGWSVQVAIDARTRELQFVSPRILTEKLRGR